MTKRAAKIEALVAELARLDAEATELHRVAQARPTIWNREAAIKAGRAVMRVQRTLNAARG